MLLTASWWVLWVVNLHCSVKAFKCCTMCCLLLAVSTGWRWNLIQVVTRIMSITTLEQHLGHGLRRCLPGLNFRLLPRVVLVQETVMNLCQIFHASFLSIIAHGLTNNTLSFISSFPAGTKLGNKSTHSFSFSFRFQRSQFQFFNTVTLVNVKKAG